MGKDSSDDSAGKLTEDSEGSSSEEELRSKRKSKKAKHSSSHKKKKSKDKKRHKKSSKKQRRRSSSLDGSASESEDEWVVKDEPKSSVPVDGEDVKKEETFKKPKLEAPSRAPTAEDEDEWANFGSALPTFSNEGKKAERKRQKEREREVDKPGQQVNELNPYWKDGGTGLPDEESVSKTKETQMIGDGGLSYLRKAYIRAKEQANEEGRSLEEVVSERWGSLEKFLGMLEEAERKAAKRDDRSSRHDDRKRFKRPDRDSDDEERYKHSEYSSSRSRRDERHRDRRRSRERDRNRHTESSSSGWRRKKDSPERIRRTPTPEPVKKPMTSLKLARETGKDFSPVPSTSSKLSSSQATPLTDESDIEEPVKVTPKILTDKEMNELGAKLLKAEMLGNTALMEELKKTISDAEAVRQDFIKNGGDASAVQTKSTKIVTKVLMDSSRGGRRIKDKVTETHKDGQRVRYFPDDDRQTLQNMFQKEKMNTAADENALFARIAGKGAKTGLDYDMDDVFTDKASSSKHSAKEQEKEVREVLDQEKQYTKIIDSCQWCFDGKIVEKHLILSVGEKSYLCVPPYQSLTEGHCLIIPMSHVSSATEIDEDVWAEMQKFRKALVRMFQEMDQDMVIFETALFLKRHPHMYLECVPMPKETGELAPIYFKKAIQECETEWSHNKKIVDLRNRDVRRAVPKGLPYFSIDFGDDSCGFAHVVEDEINFPKNFAHEIVGGMMELDHHLWRKQRKDDFKTQRNKVMEFLKHWGPFDWTRDSH